MAKSHKRYSCNNSKLEFPWIFLSLLWRKVSPQSGRLIQFWTWTSRNQPHIVRQVRQLLQVIVFVLSLFREILSYVESNEITIWSRQQYLHVKIFGVKLYLLTKPKFLQSKWKQTNELYILLLFTSRHKIMLRIVGQCRIFFNNFLKFSAMKIWS